jgi:hypothetical protein
MLNNTEQQAVEAEPMGDDDIKRYFPNAKIIVYNDLAKYNSIDELLPNDKSFIFMLIESSENKGHWVGLCRYGDTCEFFDSYGGKPDSQLKWNSSTKNEALGQDEKYLTNLLAGHGGHVVYNPIKYQGAGGDINTCGRHCCFRIQNMRDGKNLDDYYNHMKRLKNNMGVDFDGVVANFIRG